MTIEAAAAERTKICCPPGQVEGQRSRVENSKRGSTRGGADVRPGDE